MRAKHELVTKALRVVASGGISVELLLEEAAKSPGFRRWLTAEVERVCEPRRIQITREAHHDPIIVTKAIAVARRRFGKHGVITAAWGTAVRRGINHGTPCVVLFVRNKLALGRVPKRSQLPNKLEVRHGKRTIELPVDVQRMPRGRKEAGKVRPGDHSLAIIGSELGTISGIVDGNAGPCAVVSGHIAALGSAVTGRLGNGDNVNLGTVARVRNDDLVDGARVDGVSAGDIPYLSSAFQPVRDLAPGDVNIQLTVHRAQGDGDALAFVDGVGMPADFENDDGSTSSMRDLIKLSKKVSRSGDSGAPVLDNANRLVGFVIGSADGHTYVIPAQRVLDAIL